MLKSSCLEDSSRPYFKYLKMLNTSCRNAALSKICLADGSWARVVWMAVQMKIPSAVTHIMVAGAQLLKVWAPSTNLCFPEETNETLCSCLVCVARSRSSAAMAGRRRPGKEPAGEPSGSVDFYGPG